MGYAVGCFSLNSTKEKTVVMKNLIKNRTLFLFLVTGAVIFFTVASLSESICAEETSCEDAYNAFTNANWAYSAAFQSYYNGLPTTCAQDCEGVPQNQQAQCIADCQVNRQTALAAADTALFSAAWATCAPASPEECSQAQQAASMCLVEHNYLEYSDPEESLAIYAQYSACLLASKVDTCQ